MEEPYLWQLVFLHQSPRELLQFGAVSKTMYTISRANQAWEPKKLHVLHWCPDLLPLFERYTKDNSPHDKRVTVRQGKKRRITPQGTWYVFAKFLLRWPYQTLKKYRRTNQIVHQAIATSMLRLSLPPNIIERVEFSPVTGRCEFVLNLKTAQEEVVRLVFFWDAHTGTYESIPRLLPPHPMHVLYEFMVRFTFGRVSANFEIVTQRGGSPLIIEDSFSKLYHDQIIHLH